VDTKPPSITVTSPSSSYLRTKATSIVLKGTASDNVAVTEVTWKRGVTSGKATGTTSWTTPAITLPMGTSTFIVRAYDANGNAAWKTLTIVRY
jgi:hypothetical protein